LALSILLGHPTFVPGIDFLEDPRIEASASSYRSDFNHCEYGFQVEIPPGYVGYDENGPMDIKGVVIVLAREAARAQLSAYGLPNSMGVGSLEEAAGAISKVQCKQRGGSVLSEGHSDLKVGGLPARRVVIECRSEGRQVMDDSITMFHKEREMMYTMALRADRPVYGKYVALLDRLAQSWRLTPQSCK
jgi:hypothetical protein